MMRRITRALVLYDRQQVPCLSIHKRNAAQQGERTAPKSRGLAFARRFHARRRVMLHDISPGAREQIGRLGRQIGFGHRPIELRLRRRLIPRREQLLGDDAVSRCEAFRPARDFVSRIKVAARAAEHSESFLHDRVSNALEHGGSRLTTVNELRESSAVNS